MVFRDDEDNSTTSSEHPDSDQPGSLITAISDEKQLRHSSNYQVKTNILYKLISNVKDMNLKIFAY